MHDPSAERILVHLAPDYGEGEVRALGGGSDARPGRLDFDARIREGSSRIFVYLQPGLSTAQRDRIAVMALGTLCGGWRERQDDERQRRDRACERHQRRSTNARAAWGAAYALGYGPHDDGCASLFDGWPPRDGHACYSYLAGISLEVNLLYPPLGGCSVAC